jgi:hypothetical protein
MPSILGRASFCGPVPHRTLAQVYVGTGIVCDSQAQIERYAASTLAALSPPSNR